MPEVLKKRAFIAETIRKLTEEQRVGEVVSWPKISFVPNESAVLRGSQLWEQWEEEDSKAKLPLKATRARRTVDVAPLKAKSKPSVISQLKKGQTSSEWDFPDFDEYIGVFQESRGRGKRGRLGGRGRRGRGGGNRARGGKGIFDDITGADCAQEGQKATRGGNRGGRVNTRGNGNGSRAPHNIAEEAHEAVNWKFKAVKEKSSELMNDVTSREAKAGKEKKGKVSLRGLKKSQKELEVVKHNAAALSHEASWWVYLKFCLD